jgi:hypothetical protein
VPAPEPVPAPVPEPVPEPEPTQISIDLSVDLVDSYREPIKSLWENLSPVIEVETPIIQVNPIVFPKPVQRVVRRGMKFS